MAEFCLRFALLVLLTSLASGNACKDVTIGDEISGDLQVSMRISQSSDDELVVGYFENFNVFDRCLRLVVNEGLPYQRFVGKLSFNYFVESNDIIALMVSFHNENKFLHKKYFLSPLKADKIAEKVEFDWKNGVSYS